MNTRRETFSNLFILLVIILAFLPIITTFQDILTRIVLYFDAYRWFERIVVPYELRIVGVILNLLQIPSRAGPSYIEFIRNGQKEVIYLIWNCVGWQSFIFLGVTLITGLSGKFTRLSKIQALLIGLSGTYLINILRITLVILIYYFTGRGLGRVFHDYFSNLLSIVWLFIFWWIAYSYVLEAEGARTKTNALSDIIRYNKFLIRNLKFEIKSKFLKYGKKQGI